MSEQALRVLELSRDLGKLLQGKPPAIQGGALADCVSLWLAGHFAGSDEANAALRHELLSDFCATVRQLVPSSEAQILDLLREIEQ